MNQFIAATTRVLYTRMRMWYAQLQNRCFIAMLVNTYGTIFNSLKLGKSRVGIEYNVYLSYE